MPTTMPIHFVVALPAEARPVIDRFRLKAVEGGALFPTYAASDVRLIVSGKGRIAAGAAVAYLCGLFARDRTAIWINVGIAGQRDGELGELVAAHKVVERASNSTFFPQFIQTFSGPTATVVTVDEATDDYSDGALIDMEAAGFYRFASRAATAEMVHVLKVVSDNARQPQSQLQPSAAVGRLAARIGDIEDWVRLLQERVGAQLWSGQGDCDAIWEDMIKRFRFSATQRHQLRELIRRWYVLSGGADRFAWSASARAGSDVIRNLEQAIASCSMDFYGHSR